MTASKPSSILNTARSDPLGAGIVVCAVALIVTLFVWLAEPYDAKAGAWRLPTLTTAPARVPKPLPRPPDEWRAKARQGDVLHVPGIPVAYWGNPDATYGERVTDAKRAFAGIVIHFTDETPALRLVKYGHSSDPTRGGASYGYHFYIDPDGRVLQGAPLSVRTNHVKPTTAQVRREAGAHLDGTNSIGVSLIGACRGAFYACTSEKPTATQLAVGMAVVRSLQRRFKIKCGAVFGHGELQTDRRSFEGITLAAQVRAGCS